MKAWLWLLALHLMAVGVSTAQNNDLTAGEPLFFLYFARCHGIRGEGGRLGPDLTYIGSQRSPTHLRASILEPDEEISAAYWSVEATARDGQVYSGMRLNEDTYSVQFIDLNENLHSLAKENLRT